MSDPIIEAVALRYKAASESWFTATTDQLPLEDAEVYVREDVKLARGYKAKCMYLAQVFRKLAEPLESPQISVFADRIEKRVQEFDQLMALIQSGAKLFKKTQGEFDQLIEDLADNKTHRGGFIEVVYDLPGIESILKIADVARKIQDRFTKEDEEGYIDWLLEGYIGPESGVGKKIEKNGSNLSEWFTDRFSGVYALYGFVKYFIDIDYIQSMVDEIRESRGDEQDDKS
jgi:hypothetical protein